MVDDLEIFKRLYLLSLTSYGLITGLADFSFTEGCYWYLQSPLNPCLKAAPLSVEKPDFPDFTCPEILIELPVMANVMIFIFHNDIHDSFNFIHGVQLVLSWQQWLYSISRSFSLLMQFESSLSGMKGSCLVNANFCAFASTQNPLW